MANFATAVNITSNAYRVARSIAECSVVVGMHPDQALNAIVELALAFNKPFAVVPCCVFSRQFTRRLRSGSAVSTYSDLLAWVQEQAPGVQQTQLPIAGKNVMLYKLPEAA